MTAIKLHGLSFTHPVPVESGQRARWLGPASALGSLHLRELLSTPVDISSLAGFRILFGLVLSGAMIRFLARGWVSQLYIEPSFFFTYPGFEWVRPWPAPLMYAHFVLLAALALGMALGCFYRLCSVLFFLGFTYVELLDQTNYLNHYYLISLLSGLMSLLPAHRAWSIDAWRRPELRAEVVPGWCLHLLRFQVGLVYLFAGLAKFNSDWLLHAQPLRLWLAARGDLPWLGPWLGQLWVAYAASWFGALFDTSIVVWLLFRPTRRLAYALVLIFHVATGVLFNIGIFPWLMVIAATLLLPADWPRYWLGRLRPRWPSVPARPMAGARASSEPLPALLLVFLGAYALVQVALPLRSYFASQPVAWTCAGFNCAWRVMIAEKSGYAEFYASDPVTGQKRRLSLIPYLTARQEMMMAQDPYLIRAMARRLAADQTRQTGVPVRITVNAFATLNGRPSQPLIDPEVDLAGPLPSKWIEPLHP